MTDQKSADRATSIDILARTIWGEARGEGEQGMHAVANVIMNRVARPGWWGKCVASVCQKDRQFSCWNAGDPNREKLLSISDDDSAFLIAQRIAAKAVDGVLSDKTNSATHYHTRAIMPYWAKAETPCFELGNHVFYREPDK